MILCIQESSTEMQCGSCVMPDGNSSYRFSQKQMKLSFDPFNAVEHKLWGGDFIESTKNHTEFLLLVLFCLLLVSFSW